MTIQSGKVRTCRLFTERRRDYEFVVILTKVTRIVTVTVTIRDYPESYVYAKELILKIDCSKNLMKLPYANRRKIRLLVERDISRHFRSKAVKGRGFSWTPDGPDRGTSLPLFTGNMIGANFLKRRKK